MRYNSRTTLTSKKRLDILGVQYRMIENKRINQGWILFMFCCFDKSLMQLIPTITLSLCDPDVVHCYVTKVTISANTLHTDLKQKLVSLVYVLLYTINITLYQGDKWNKWGHKPEICILCHKDELPQLKWICFRISSWWHILKQDINQPHTDYTTV
jgi:hypothetical protein